MSKTEAQGLAQQTIRDLEYFVRALEVSDVEATKIAYTKFLQNVDKTCAIQLDSLN